MNARLALLAISAMLLAVGGAGCGQTSGSSPEPAARTSKPSAAHGVLGQTPDSARSIVTSLWTRRENALASLDTRAINRFESGYARQQDNAYINAVRCRCEPPKDAHGLDLVVPQIPKAASVQPAFFAQVHATNADTGEQAWYVVAVERAGTGWKFAHVNFGGYKAAPPLRAFTHSDGYTPRVTTASRARMTRLAEASIQFANTHNPLTHRTEYGATVRSRYAIKPGKDGIYGLALPSGEVLSCFAMHRSDTYSLQSGLLQGRTRNQWGRLLRPGIYESITIDNAAPMCVVGQGTRGKVGTLEFKYDKRVVGTTGIPK
jgi:hypothetical protein